MSLPVENMVERETPDGRYTPRPSSLLHRPEWGAALQEGLRHVH